jgi:hypothetical protein
MSVQITTLSENTAARINLLVNSIMLAHASIYRGCPLAIQGTFLFVITNASLFLSLRAKRGNLLSSIEIASAD